MKRAGREIFGACAVAMAVLAAGSARADANPFVGRWHWDRAQSTLPPDEPAPPDLIADISRGDQDLSWSVTVTTPDRQSHVERRDPDERIYRDTSARLYRGSVTLRGLFIGPS
jgi:hypothetical protein